MMPKWRVFAPSRLHHCFFFGGGEGCDGGLSFHFILSKIVRLVKPTPHTIRPITPSSAVDRYCALPIVMARNSSTSVIFQPRERHMRSLPTCGGDFCNVTFESQKQVFDCFSQWLVLCFLHSSFISSSAAIMEEQTITSPSRYMLVSQGFQASESSTMWLPLRAWNRRQSWHMARVRTH